MKISNFNQQLIWVLLLNSFVLLAVAETPIEALGKKLFFDNNLSEPAGQSCASCHASTAGFADPDAELSVSRGIYPNRFGSRNTPTLAYAKFSPDFHYEKSENHFVGGQFLDGRAAILEDQAKLPFTNPVEMANKTTAQVVAKVRHANYKDDFDFVFGKASLKNTERTFENMAKAIAAFERSSMVNAFSSKYDAFLANNAVLSKQEMRGLELFKAEDKGNCAACHPADISDNGRAPLFTDFTYDNLGVPANTKSPFYRQAKEFNADGLDFIDEGLSKTTSRAEDRGQFKVSTLRNIALTAPYMHNGKFETLQEVVDFYNTRDVKKDWGNPEVPETMNTDELGDLGLTQQEVDDIVSFMKTLSDGYLPQ